MVAILFVIVEISHFVALIVCQRSVINLNQENKGSSIPTEIYSFNKITTG